MLFGLHLFQLLVIFNKANLIPSDDSHTKLQNYGRVAIFLIPFFLIFSLFIKKTELKQMKYDEYKIKKGNFLLVIYIISSILLLGFLIFINRVKR